ncbi:MAG: hypothetical protein ACK4QW_07190, partial [Alphaproteobacteria bacterium]
PAASPAAAEEPTHFALANPSRVTLLQSNYVSFDASQRYLPVRAAGRAGRAQHGRLSSRVAEAEGIAAWSAFDAELDRWAASGRTATFWWRDDDAVDDGPALDRLATAAGPAPVALAVIPREARPALAARIGVLPGWRALQHGFRHTNHAPAGEKKAEFGAHRPIAAMAAELLDGQARLSALFGDRFLPVFVPPWNRIGAPLADRLPALGYAGLSTFGGKGAGSPGLVRLDCRCDPLDWRGRRDFVGSARALAPILAHLHARRGGAVPDEPTGLLTHHVVMDAGAWDFCATIRKRTAVHRAARWLAPEEAFPAARKTRTEA